MKDYPLGKGSKSSFGVDVKIILSGERLSIWKWWWIGANCDSNLGIIGLSVNIKCCRLWTTQVHSTWFRLSIVDLFIYMVTCPNLACF